MINVLLTTKCNFKCAHCLFSCTMWGKPIKPIVRHRVAQILEQIGSGVNILGGEPTLYPEYVSAVKQFVIAQPSAPFLFTTNGSWVYYHDRRREFMEMVQWLMGMCQDKVTIRISDDPYHRPFWRFPDHIARIRREFEDYGFATGGRPYFYLDTTARGSEQVITIGRAVKTQLAGWNGACLANCCNSSDEERNEKWWSPFHEAITIFPDGRVSPCCQGVPIVANLAEESVSTVEQRLRVFFEHRKRNLTYDNCQKCRVWNLGAIQKARA